MKYSNLFRAATLMLFSLLSCTKYEQYETGPDYYETADIRNDEIVTGRKLEDPFAIRNIRIAYDSLAARIPGMPEFNIKSNNIYLRFLPADEKELNILKNDTTLLLFDYPLDYEITGLNGAETGSSHTESPRNWLYCVVPADKQLPDVFHEVLYEVFIPTNDDYTLRSSSAGPQISYEALITESARLTGNLPDSDSLERQLRGSGRWYPAGRIRVWDDLMNDFIPVSHVNVHARWFTHIETDLTDENGYFRTGSFRHKVNYSIKWENSRYTIRNGFFLQAWYNGPKLKGDWNLNIKGGKAMMHATIHRAASKYFYGDALGLSRPDLKYGSRTKICYMDKCGTGLFLGDWSASGVMPDILIYGESDGNCRSTNKVYGSTIHELGHQAHSQAVGNINFWQSSRMIKESWADAVEWALTNDEYNKLGMEYGNVKAAKYNHEGTKHDSWPFVNDRDYSPIFIDLIDKINQRESFGPGYPNDLITQYSLSFLNSNLLSKSLTIGSLRNEISKNKLEGVTDADIDELFMLY